MNASLPFVLVGVLADHYPPKYYLGFQPVPTDREHLHVRQLLEARLGELAGQVDALREILATDDPEHAEHALCDPSRIQVSEVILRPALGRAAIAAFVEQRFTGQVE
jgi:hypothetical protein